MKVKENTKPSKQVPFSSLCIGDVYRDRDNVLCIKTGNTCCIFYSNVRPWDYAHESEDSLVTPVSATLVLDD